MEEIWKTIPDYPYYECSTLGNIRAKSTKRIVKPMANNCGYFRIMIARPKSISVHRLVAHTFLDFDLKSILTIDHINGVKSDNRLVNLQIMTKEDNVRKGAEDLRRRKEGEQNGITSNIRQN